MRTRRAGALVAALLVLAASCTNGGGGGHRERTLTVFAASSLSGPFEEIAKDVERMRPGLHVRLTLGGSQELVLQIQQGAPAGVVATADERTMTTLQNDGNLAKGSRVFARNRLEIAVAKGNPKGIHGLADLARPGVTVVLADPVVPAGRYAATILKRAKVTVHPKSLENDVRSALTKVELGEADAAIVYVTDVRSAGGKVAGVEIDKKHNVVARYVIAVTASAAKNADAKVFVRRVRSSTGKDTLARFGFLGV